MTTAGGEIGALKCFNSLPARLQEGESAVDMLQQQIGGNSIAAYMSIIVFSLVVVLAVAALRYVLVKRLTVIALRTDTAIDDLIVRMLQSINLLVVLALTLSTGLLTLELPEKIVHILPVVTVAAIFVQVGLWGETAIRALVTRNVDLSSEGTGTDSSTPAQRAVIFLSRWLLWSLVLILILENAGVDLSALLAGLGIGGIAIALAVQNILGDLFCFVAIILDKPFEYGDFVVVGDLRGTVERIGIKTTRIRSLDGEQLIFSNNDLVSSRVRNFKRMQRRRVLFRIGVTYETPVEKLRNIPKVVENVIGQIEDTQLDRVHFASFGDFSINYEIVYYVNNSDYNRYMDVQQAINLAICERFAKQGIDFAYPTQTMYLHAQSRLISEVAQS